MGYCIFHFIEFMPLHHSKHECDEVMIAASTFYIIKETCFVCYTQEAYSDATVACEGKFFPVHKLVMSSCSDYFEQIFQVVQCRHPVIVLKDITYQHMDLLLSYMYLGEVKVCIYQVVIYSENEICLWDCLLSHRKPIFKPIQVLGLCSS